MRRKFGLNLRPRPWYEWLLWVAWLLLEIFLLQNAITSAYPERQPRAAIIFGILFSLLLLAGVIAWFVRRPKENHK